MASRLLRERRFEAGIAADTERSVARPVRSVTFNAAESPLGWLFARDLITQRQFDAGERLRADWERAQLSPRVTMAWDASPVARGRGGSGGQPDLNGAQIDAKRRFKDQSPARGQASPTSCGASFATGRGCAKRSPRWAGRRARASSC